MSNTTLIMLAVLGTFLFCFIVFMLILSKQGRKHQKQGRVAALRAIETFINQIPFGTIVFNPNTQKEFFNSWVKTNFQPVEGESQWQAIESGAHKTSLMNFYRLKRDFYVKDRSFSFYLPLAGDRKLHVQALLLKQPEPLYFIFLSFDQSAISFPETPHILKEEEVAEIAQEAQNTKDATSENAEAPIMPNKQIQVLQQALMDAEENTKKARAKNNRMRKFYNHVLDEIPMPLWIRDSHDIIFENQLALKEKLSSSLADAPVKSSIRTWDIEERILNKDGIYLGIAQQKTQEISAPKNLQASTDVHTDIPQPPQFSGVGFISNTPAKNPLSVDFAALLKADSPTSNSTSNIDVQVMHAIDHTGLAFAVFDQDKRLIAHNAQLRKLWHLDHAQLEEPMNFQNFYFALREAGHFELNNHKDWLWRQEERFIQPFPLVEDLLHMHHKTIKQYAVRTDDKYFIWFFDDITESTELERSITALNTKQDRILDNLPDGLLLFTDSRKVLFANPALENMWSINLAAHDEAENDTFLPINDENEHKAKEHTIEEFIDHLKPYIMKAHDQYERNISDWQSVLLDKEQQNGQITTNDGRLMEFLKLPLASGEKLLVFRDQTQKQRLAQEKEISKKALGYSLERTYKFIADFSARLRNPSASILSISEILNLQKYGNLNSRQKDYLQDLLSASKKLDTTLQDLVDISAIYAGNMHLQRETMTILDAFKDPLMQLDSAVAEQKIKLAVQMPNDYCYISVDPTRIKQVINVLMHTILEFARPMNDIPFIVSRGANSVHTQIDFALKPNASLTPILDEEHNLPVEAIGSLELIYELVRLHGGDLQFQYNSNDQIGVKLSLPLVQKEKKKSVEINYTETKLEEI